MSYDTLPCNFGVEQSLLGALIFNNPQIDMVSDRLSEISFYADQHKIIWRALIQIRQSGGIADANTLLEFFSRDKSLEKIGGEKYLATLVNNMALEPEIDDYAGILADLENRRGLIQMAQKVEASSINPEIGQSAAEIATQAQSVISGIMLGTSIKPPTQIQPGIKSYIEKIKAAKKNDDQPFLKTNITKLDKRLGGGLFAPDLVILAGRPSMGKSMVALAIADGAARGQSVKEPSKKASVLFHSMEMSDEQIIARNMTLNSHMNYGKRYSSRNMRAFQIKDEQLDAMQDHAQLIGDIHIDDRAALRLRDVRVRALDHIRRIGYLDLIVIDYLTIMGHEPDDIKKGLNYAVGIITAGLKRLAKELGIPILVLAQLSRQVEQRDDKRPQLSDLRDSGSIEQDADIVLFCYRERYYVEKAEPKEGSKNYQERHDSWTMRMGSTEHEVEIFAAKQRLGPVGGEKLWCDLMTGYVGDCDPVSMYGSAAPNDPRYQKQYQ